MMAPSQSSWIVPTNIFNHGARFGKLPIASHLFYPIMSLMLNYTIQCFFLICFLRNDGSVDRNSPINNSQSFFELYIMLNPEFKCDIYPPSRNLGEKELHTGNFLHLQSLEWQNCLRVVGFHPTRCDCQL